TVPATPGIAVSKTGALASGATGRAGDTVNYTFTVRNSGNTTLTGVTVADPLTGLSAITYAWPGTAGRLTPGQSASGTATYKLTQKDVDAGFDDGDLVERCDLDDAVEAFGGHDELVAGRRGAAGEQHDEDRARDEDPPRCRADGTTAHQPAARCRH
ncbi:DUF11 domain-containing protein, partial [Bacillus sp. S34]|nr:DUF11 domain-containing protein [Bacillus sp. S34]